MTLSVSNLAWDHNDNESIFSELKKLNINHVEGVLTKIDSWGNLNSDVIKRYKERLDNHNIKIKSIQSIFYGVDVNGFHDTNKIVQHIEKLIGYCKILGVNVMVLGSPTLRRDTKNLNQSLKQTFKLIDELLHNTDIELSIEPNTKEYGGSYFFNLEEICGFILNSNLRKIKTMVDTHNLLLENNDPCTDIKEYFEYINHVHISEPNLGPINNINFHEKFSRTLKELNYNKIITLEMKKNDEIVNNIKLFSTIYDLN